MNAVDYIIIALIAAVLGFAVFAIYKSGKSGKRCIGCPDSCACTQGNCTSGCNGCGKQEKDL